MSSYQTRTLGRFATFFTFALPTFVGITAVALHRPFVNLVGEKGFAAHWLGNFFFNHFALALAIPAGAAVLLSTLCIFALRRKDTEPTCLLGELFVLQAISAIISTAWLAAYLLSAVIG